MGPLLPGLGGKNASSDDQSGLAGFRGSSEQEVAWTKDAQARQLDSRSASLSPSLSA
jgi:hypothetical protein